MINLGNIKFFSLIINQYVYSIKVGLMAVNTILTNFRQIMITVPVRNAYKSISVNIFEIIIFFSTLLLSFLADGGNSKGWRTDNCGALNKPLCKARKGSKPIPTSPPSPPISGFCPTGWFGSADKCFKVVSLKQSLNWRDAKSVCNRFNISADLATISNARENLLVLSNIKEDERSNQFWFGAVRSRRRNSAYVWIDNSNIRPDDFNDFDNDINVHIEFPVKVY